jgi:anti-sigma factor RsiW
MTCHDARDQLSALLDGALGADEGGAVERHLDGCADCRRELERLRGTVALLRRLEPARAPAGFVGAVLRATRPRYRRLLDAAFLPLSAKLPVELAAAAMIAVLGFQLVRDGPAFRGAVSERGDHAAAGAPGTGTPAESPPAPKALATRPWGGAPPAASSPDVPSRTRASPGLEGDSGAPASGPDPTSSRVTAAAPVFRPAKPTALGPDCCVRGTLAAADRSRAASQVVELATRLGGTEVARRTDADRTVIDISVSREAYPAFVDGLRRLGRFTVERAPAQFPAAVQVGIDIVQ